MLCTLHSRKGEAMMKIVSSLAFLLCVLFSVSPARADLNSFMSGLNVQAQADLPGFQLKISAQFGVPLPQVQTVVQQVAQPADAFMVFQLGEMAQKPPETVVQTYTANKTKGWGVIAQQLGIKPGSPEFHALKAGNLQFTGKRSGGAAPGGAAAAPGGTAPAPAAGGPPAAKGKGKK
jgi:hypothetical protein